MSQLPLVSIILPVYNGEKYLRESVNSCINQSYINWELIIINDASTDSSAKIATDFQNQDQRIKVYSNETNLSLPASLNKGHKIAKGDFLTWTSDDNILKENFLQSLLQKLNNSECGIVFSNYDIIWKDGSFKREHITGPVEEILFGNIIGASFLYKRQVFDVVGGYSKDLFLAEDYNFFLMASLKFEILHVDENLYKYRIHQQSLSGAIQSKSSYREKHRLSVNKMFNDLGDQLNMDSVFIQFLLDLYLKNKISVRGYLSNKKLIKSELIKYINVSRSSNENKVLAAFHRRLINNWIQSESSIKKIDMIKIAVQDPLLFIHGFQNRSFIKLMLR